MFRLKSWWMMFKRKRKYDGYANSLKNVKIKKKRLQVVGEGLSEVHCCTCTHTQLWCQIVHHHCRVCHPYLVEAISENCMELSCYVKWDCFADRLLTFPLYQPGVIVWDNHWESAKSGISLFIPLSIDFLPLIHSISGSWSLFQLSQGKGRVQVVSLSQGRHREIDSHS